MWRRVIVLSEGLLRRRDAVVGTPLKTDVLPPRGHAPGALKGRGAVGPGADGFSAVLPRAVSSVGSGDEKPEVIDGRHPFEIGAEDFDEDEERHSFNSATVPPPAKPDKLNPMLTHTARHIGFHTVADQPLGRPMRCKMPGAAMPARMS